MLVVTPAAVDALQHSLVAVVTNTDREASERSEPTACGLETFILKYFCSSFVPLCWHSSSRWKAVSDNAK